MKSSGFKKPSFAPPKDVNAFISGSESTLAVEVKQDVQKKPATNEKSWERLHVQVEGDLYSWLQETRAPKQSLGDRTRQVLREMMEREAKK